MVEYIDREKALNAIYERIDELRADKEFDLAKQICVSGVKKYIRAIPTADVVEKEKIDKAIQEMKIEIYCDNGFSQGVRRAMEILERNIRE